MLLGAVTLLVVSFLTSSCGHRLVVKKHDPALLRCSSPCHGEVKWALSQHLKESLVTECEQEVCAEGDAFKNRTKVIQGSLLLDPAVYSDSGRYKCYCNGSVLCDRHLHVVRALIIIGVSVGENVTLPCFVCTDKSDVKIRWVKDGRLVWKLQRGVISHGSCFKQGASVSASRHEDGSLFLTISKFRASDEGLYCCCCGKKKLLCYKAVLLTGTKSATETGNSGNRLP